LGLFANVVRIRIFFGFGIKMSFVEGFKEHIASIDPLKIIVQNFTIVNKGAGPS
jgi:hypothetical protein